METYLGWTVMGKQPGRCTNSLISLFCLQHVKENVEINVENRCKEICNITSKENWYHISGNLNPADLPSRECGAKDAYESRWWEGPNWPKNDASEWPMSSINLPDSKAYSEKKKTVVTATTTEKNHDFSTLLLYFSSYLKLLRMVAWILRFSNNSRRNPESKNGTLSTEEIKLVEEKIISCLQQESFREDPNFQKTIPVFVDDKGLLRVKTRLVLNDDSEYFKFPILLPSSHPIVARIIMEQHIIHQHAGLQSMIVIIRERFLIPKGQKSIRNVLSRCFKCNKFKAKAGEAPTGTWKFNPPSAPWWGGMWERLVRMVKELLRRNLGLAKVDYEDLMTLLCDFEVTINSRPLTYVSDDYDTLQPLTPSMFLQPIVRSDVHDLDLIDSNSLNKRVKYLQKLRENLRSRFKTEYLAMLVHKSKGNQGKYRTISTGDIVLIGDDNVKRINWPLALVLETIPGKDGISRVAKLRTARGELTRPVQRLYSMEINHKEKDFKNDPQSMSTRETRFGRKVKMPKKMDL